MLMIFQVGRTINKQTIEKCVNFLNKYIYLFSIEINRTSDIKQFDSFSCALTFSTLDRIWVKIWLIICVLDFKLWIVNRKFLRFEWYIIWIKRLFFSLVGSFSRRNGKKARIGMGWSSEDWHKRRPCGHG